MDTPIFKELVSIFLALYAGTYLFNEVLVRGKRIYWSTPFVAYLIVTGFLRLKGIDTPAGAYIMTLDKTIPWQLVLVMILGYWIARKTGEIEGLGFIVTTFLGYALIIGLLGVKPLALIAAQPLVLLFIAPIYLYFIAGAAIKSTLHRDKE